MDRYVDSAWYGQVRRMRRSDPIYKPAMLLAVIDLIDEGLATPTFVPARLAVERFEELLVRADLAASRGPGRAHMPAYHLSTSSNTDEPFWELLWQGAPIGPQQEPSSDRVLLARADGLRLDPVLAEELMIPGGKDIARAVLYQLLEDDPRADCRTLLKWHDKDVPLVEQAADILTQREKGRFLLDDPNARKVQSFREHIIRDRSLRIAVLPVYNFACALCSTRIVWNNRYEVEVAHIKPRSMRGTDDPRNTLSLCQTHHWAFDLGLWSACDDMRVMVGAPDGTRGDDLAALRGFDGKELRRPNRASAAPHTDALRWHREHRFGQAA